MRVWVALTRTSIIGRCNDRERATVRQRQLTKPLKTGPDQARAADAGDVGARGGLRAARVRHRCDAVATGQTHWEKT